MTGNERNSQSKNTASHAIDANQLLGRVAKARAIALDLDGVVYQGTRVLPGAVTAIDLLRRLGLKIYFVTNNSGKTRIEIRDKLAKMSISATSEDVLTSGFAARVLISRLINDTRNKVFVFGSKSLKSEIAQTGAELVSSSPCDFLAVGLDTELTYEKISMALEVLLTGAVFIACNLDPVFPTEGGRLLPGCGPAVAALEAASGRKPDYIVGKPYTFLLEMLADLSKIEPYEILVVGDSRESDIAMANRFGSPSVLVASSGISISAPLALAEYKPDLIVQSLDELARVIATAHST